MNLLSSIILGAVQGITEFVPVSSTGHLVLVRDVLGITGVHGLAFDAVLHLATALAVLVYFRRELWRLVSRPKEHAVLWYALILGTLPAAILGFFFQGTVETVLRSPVVVAVALIGGSVLFVLAEVYAKHKPRITADNTRINADANTRNHLTPRKGFWVGWYQALALVPGLSRSGASISGGLLFGLSREEATRFAFLLSFPIILGVGGLKFLELAHTGLGGGLGLELAFGALVAFVFGFASIHLMIRFLKNHTLYGFAVYRVLLAIAVLFLL